MPKLDLVYKIVHRDSKGRLWSQHAISDLAVRYQIGEWSEAPVGGLLCYRTKEEALAAMIIPNSHWCILRCMAKDPVPLPPGRLQFAYSKDRAFNHWHGVDVETWYQWPKGTVAYRALMPISQTEFNPHKGVTYANRLHPQR